MNLLNRLAFWIYDRLFGARFKAVTLEDLREERTWYAEQIKTLRKQKKRHSHLLPGFQHVTSEIIRMEIGK